ncbi:nuclear transport factor 2 family protein [Mesobacillus maritimus]|uniref:nuclear transport factor 2 family protein n=1 Tax=Mesobacillus maritimus TaxID=1643336 RepID=UPI003D812CBB
MREMSTEKFHSNTIKEIAVSFLKEVASGNVREAYQNYVAPNFKHHNPYFRGDANTLMLAMEENAAASPSKSFEVKFAIQEKETVVVYSHVKQKPKDLGVAVVHIFRFQENQIVELWDLGTQIPEDSPNENGMF